MIRIIAFIILVIVSTSLTEAGCNKFKYCPNCRYELKPEWNNCPNCGYKFCTMSMDSIMSINQNDSVLELKADCIASIKRLERIRYVGIAMAIGGPVLMGAMTITYFNAGKATRNEEGYREFFLVGGVIACAGIPMIVIPTKRIKMNTNIIKSINIGLLGNRPGLLMNATF
jgi:hypothetical protein